jgi:hypothetical protein
MIVSKQQEGFTLYIWCRLCKLATREAFKNHMNWLVLHLELALFYCKFKMIFYISSLGPEITGMKVVLK